MDHDHMVLIMFCHHAGTASPWFELLRRAASWTSVFGRFCTAETLLSETADLLSQFRLNTMDFVWAFRLRLRFPLFHIARKMK